MYVLLACEESQAVCLEMRKRGHVAFSCDILPCSGGHPEWHIQGDVLSFLGPNKYNDFKGWDMLIGFPPCTHLSGAGAPSWHTKQADGRQGQAFEFVLKLWNACDVVCVENPQGWLNTNWQKPTQTVHPYYFGDPYLKRTCFWLKDLPQLKDTNVVKPKFHYTSNSTRGGLLKDGTRRKSKLPIYKAWDNSIERSKTFTGIARAMAEQWG